ncbi:hypothetical protein E2562_011084 [Oryza meyeriana var. granulata]|uniref:Uncharacterized protein n=1 Tax=Oryza meyeriana var. granulata TaxID=110450 RepID=A0A6G1EWI9_9ORYZ|nr:hypothetical protein E2562_011084 [Oryza meyeriana var. granulata]
MANVALHDLFEPPRNEELLPPVTSDDAGVDEGALERTVMRALFKPATLTILPMSVFPLQLAYTKEQVLQLDTRESTVRRSPRLAKKITPSVMTTMKAYLNPCRRQGLVPKGGVLTDQALEEYKAMFSSPLPPEAIEALTLLFGLNNT